MYFFFLNKTLLKAGEKPIREYWPSRGRLAKVYGCPLGKGKPDTESNLGQGGWEGRSGLASSSFAGKLADV